MQARRTVDRLTLHQPGGVDALFCAHAHLQHLLQAHGAAAQDLLAEHGATAGALKAVAGCPSFRSRVPEIAL